MPSPSSSQAIAQSVVDTGERFFAVNPAVYEQLRAGINSLLGYPRGIGSLAYTLSAIPEVGDLPVANDGSGMVLISVRAGAIDEDLSALLADPISQGLVVPLDWEDFKSLKPSE